MGVQENWLANLRALVDRESSGPDKRLGYKAVAARTGVSEEYVYQLYNGKPKADGSARLPGPDIAKKLALAYAEGRSLDWIDQPPVNSTKPKVIDSRSHRVQGAPIPIPYDNNPDYPAIPRVRLRIAAGITGFSAEEVEDVADPIVFRQDWYQERGFNPERLVAFRVSGESMEPGLWDGDTVVINTVDTRPQDGKVFAVNYEGELVVKRLVRDGGTWWLSSDNPDQRLYGRKHLHEDAIIIGKVVHKQSERI